LIHDVTMTLAFRTLRSGERLDLPPPGECLQLVLASGRSMSLTVNGDHSYWVCLRGDPQVESGDGSINLPAGHMLIADGRMWASVRQQGTWLTLTGTTAAWSRALAAVVAGPGAREPLFYPHAGPCPRYSRRALARLAQACRRSGDHAIIRTRLDQVLFALWNDQCALDDLSHRCTGRTQARRRQNLMRLIRVRHRISMNPTRRVELSSLAAGASYSPWHLTRMFRDVFGEAPCEYGMKVRLEHARRLIRTSRMSVAEVADAVGYESRSAFSRSFRQVYGVSATQVRGPTG
jgi:AraC family transcriptional regulator